MTDATTTRGHLVRFRFRRHQLDRPPGTARSKLPDVVDYGVQDTGPDGAAWALAIRGAAPGVVGLELAWTLRGAPHAYRRSDLKAIAVATAPYDSSDAAKRIFDASKPLVGAGIDVIDALRTIAEEQRSIVTKPLVKGEVSTRLTKRLKDPFLRWCRPCNATHLYENPFRLAALQAGLVLEWDTSPPVMRRAPRLRPALYGTLAVDADRRFDVIRNHLRFYPGARYRDVASFLDAPIKVVKDRWPDDAVEVAVSGDKTPGKESRFVLSDDVDDLLAAGDEADNGPPTVRLLGPYDPYLQLRDRELLVSDADHRKDLWRVLGRPGAIVDDGEIVGSWRPRASKGKLRVEIDPWRRLSSDRRDAIAEQCERLAAFRNVRLVS